MTLRNCFFLPLCFALAFVCVSCAQPASCTAQSSNRITLMSWNTQLFFDPYINGSEYAQYTDPNSRWNVDTYRTRLDRLCEVVLSAGLALGEGPQKGPDFVVLQEIENARVVEDICNTLPFKSKYEIAVFVPPEKGVAFGTAVLSRLPVIRVTSHTVAVSHTGVRPLLHCEFQFQESTFHLFCVHWKSKYGKNDSSSIRLLQENLLIEQLKNLELQNPHYMALSCGDFNQTEEEFTLMNEYWNPWGEIAGGGSYYYQGNWERIDHVFCSPVLHNNEGVEATGFKALKDAKFLTSGGLPARYELYNGKGYSDHLPILIEITCLE